MIARLGRRGFVGGAAVFSAALWLPRLARAAQAMGFDDARHLLSRTSFGATPAEIQALASLDYATAVDRQLGYLSAQGEGAQLQILAHGHQRKVATALWHEADAELQPLLGRQPLDQMSAEVRGAVEMAVKTVDCAQQRRLAAPFGPMIGGIFTSL